MMKQTATFLLVTLVTALIIAQCQAKKGCEAFGHACYGGHGKRSVGATGVEELRPDTILQAFPNDGRDLDQYRRFRMINILRQLVNGRRPMIQQLLPSDRLNNNDLEYSTSSENFKDNSVLN